MVTVIIHVIALPIAAHFGAFDKLKQRFGEARVVLVPLKQEKEKQQAKEKKAKPKIAKAQGKAVVKRGGPAKANPNRQKVVAVNNPNGAGADNGPTIEQGTRTNVGEIPTPKTDTGPSKAAGTGGTDTTSTTPVELTGAACRSSLALRAEEERLVVLRPVAERADLPRRYRHFGRRSAFRAEHFRQQEPRNPNPEISPWAST